MRLGLFALLILGCGLFARISYAQDQIAIVSTALLNMRSEASQQSRIVAVLIRGTQVKVLDGDGGEFVQVERIRDGKVGFVSAEYVMYRSSGSLEQAVVEIPPPIINLPPNEPQPVSQAQPPPVVVVPPDATLEQIHTADAAIMTAPVELSSAPRRGQRWSISLQVGTAQSDMTGAKLERALQSAAGFAQVRNLDESSLSWDLNIAYRFTPTWSLELGALALGSYDSRIDIRNADQAAVRALLADQHPVGGTGLRVAIRAQKQLARWTPSASLGLFQSSDTDIDAIIDGQQQAVEGESLSAVVNAAMGYRLNQHWTVDFSLSYLQLNQDIVKPALALRYQY